MLKLYCHHSSLLYLCPQAVIQRSSLWCPSTWTSPRPQLCKWTSEV